MGLDDPRRRNAACRTRPHLGCRRIGHHIDLVGALEKDVGAAIASSPTRLCEAAAEPRCFDRPCRGLEKAAGDMGAVLCERLDGAMYQRAAYILCPPGPRRGVTLPIPRGLSCRRIVAVFFNGFVAQGGPEIFARPLAGASPRTPSSVLQLDSETVGLHVTAAGSRRAGRCRSS